jgi:peptide/nickel transport system ATP-binding protein
MSDRVMVMYLGQIVELGQTEAIYNDTQHPYTRALLGSMLSMDPDKRTSQAPLTGDPPNPINPPPGCRFHTRCVHATGICRANPPLLRASGEAHEAACHMVDPASGYYETGPDA